MTTVLNLLQAMMLCLLVFIILDGWKNLRRSANVLKIIEEMAEEYEKELEVVTRISKILRAKEDETLEEKLHRENLNHANEEE